MKVIYYLLQVGLSIMQVNWLYFVLKHGLKRLFPLVNALDTMDCQNSQVGNLFLKCFAKLYLCKFSTFKLFYGFIDFLYASFSCLNRWNYFLNKGSLLWNIRELMLNVFQNSHWVVLSIEHFRHELPWFYDISYIWQAGTDFSYHKVFKSLKALFMASFRRY